MRDEQNTETHKQRQANIKRLIEWGSKSENLKENQNQTQADREKEGKNKLKNYRITFIAFLLILYFMGLNAKK